MSERRHEPRRRPWPARNSGQLLLIAAAGVVLVASVAQTAVAGVRDPRIAFAFGALIAFGEVLRLNLPGDRESAPIGMAGASPTPAHPGRGSPGSAQRRAGGHRHRHRHDRRCAAAPGRWPAGEGERDGRRLLCVACVAFIFRPLAGDSASSATGAWPSP